jgi:hypothetical protein
MNVGMVASGILVDGPNASPTPGGMQGWGLGRSEAYARESASIGLQSAISGAGQAARGAENPLRFRKESRNPPTRSHHASFFVNSLKDSRLADDVRKKIDASAPAYVSFSFSVRYSLL